MNKTYLSHMGEGGFDPAAGGAILATNSFRDVLSLKEAKIPHFSVLKNDGFNAVSRLTPPAA